MQLSLNYSMGCAWLHEMGTEKGNVSRLGGVGGGKEGSWPCLSPPVDG